MLDGPAGIAAAAETLGGLEAVVHAVDADGLAEAPFAECDDAAWLRLAETPIWESLTAFQAAYAAFAGGGGSIVALVPSIALTGAARLAPFASACEGVRQLVKSAARAWGRERITVNCLTLPIEAWGLEPAHPVPNRYGPSLDRPAGDAELAGAIAYLAGPLGAAVTGATIGLDRGTVLAP